MTYRGATGLLVTVVAVSSAAWSIHTAAEVAGLPFQAVAVLIALLPHAAAVAAAAVVVLRAPAWWRRAGLAYVAAFTALESVGLVQIVTYASQHEVGEVVWIVATSSLALATAILSVLAVRRVPAEDEDSTPGPPKWAAVIAGLLLVASSVFAWSVTEHAPAGRWTFTLGHASPGVLVGSLAGMAVIAGITAVVAISSEQAVVVGAAAGLLASRPPALSVFADPSWRDANAMLAAGWWIALVAQTLLVAAAVMAVVRREGTPTRPRPECPPTSNSPYS